MKVKPWLQIYGYGYFLAHSCTIFLALRTFMCECLCIETEMEMRREQFLKALRKYARKRDLRFEVDKKKGDGSHYIVLVGSERTTVQSDLNPGRIERCLKQLNIDPAAL